jgi:hypothetical protein
MIRTAPDLNPPEDLWNAEDDKIGNCTGKIQENRQIV